MRLRTASDGGPKNEFGLPSPYQSRRPKVKLVDQKLMYNFYEECKSFKPILHKNTKHIENTKHKNTKL